MQTLVFNTTTKEVKILENGTIMYSFINVPTVKPMDGYYEVYVKYEDWTGNTSSTVPVFRAPISNTNMLIQK